MSKKQSPAAAYMQKRRKARREQLIDMLGAQCEHCGTKDKSVLEFDHKRPKNKEFDIANAKDSPMDKLVKEVKKCRLLCHNCHILKTRKSFDFGSEPSKHGTIWHYKKFKCRCKKCRKAMSDYLKNKKIKLLKVVRVAENIAFSLQKYGIK